MTAEASISEPKCATSKGKHEHGPNTTDPRRYKLNTQHKIQSQGKGNMAKRRHVRHIADSNIAWIRSLSLDLQARRLRLAAEHSSRLGRIITPSSAITQSTLCDMPSVQGQTKN